VIAVFHYENQCFEITEGQFMVSSGRMNYMSHTVQNSIPLKGLKPNSAHSVF
jgi:hypothetical protein